MSNPTNKQAIAAYKVIVNYCKDRDCHKCPFGQLCYIDNWINPPDRWPEIKDGDKRGA